MYIYLSIYLELEGREAFLVNRRLFLMKQKRRLDGSAVLDVLVLSIFCFSKLFAQKSVKYETGLNVNIHVFCISSNISCINLREIAHGGASM